ncbi:MAG TPA: hypothetical protein VN730_01260 [Steroidobacteraceae bacterium]|nr:hypothetical protein [Steroidobacteraceae bacterium]
MKLRIRGQHLRIRTDAEEMRAFASAGCIEERIQLAPDRALIYRLAIAPGAKAIGVAFEDNLIEVRLPEEAAKRWCSTDLTALSGTQQNGPVELRVTVEKDFDSRE